MFYQDISPNFFHHIFSNEDFSPNTSDQRLFTKNLLPIFLHQYFPPIISHPEFAITNSQSKFPSKHFPPGISQQKMLTKNFPLREAIVQKITEFYEIISQTGGGGSIGFHISYSEIVDTPKSVAKSE